MSAPEISDALLRTADLLAHERMPGGYRLMVLKQAQIASRARPGQFVHLRVPRLRDRILRRPFSIFKVEGDEISIIYKCVGTGTDVLACAPAGDRVSLLGPLGNGFPEPGADSFPLLVGGGYGAGAVYMTARRSPVKGAVFIGGRSADDILCAEDYEQLGWPVHLASEDGTRGQRGMVTDALDDWLAGRAEGLKIEIFACGPHPMLAAVAERAIAIDCQAWISLDRPMGCGVGACLACVQKIRSQDGDWVYARTCKEGPVFECRDISWKDLSS